MGDRHEAGLFATGAAFVQLDEITYGLQREEERMESGTASCCSESKST